MKKLWILAAVLSLCTACAHETPQPVTIEGEYQGVKLDWPGILSLTAADIQKLQGAIESSQPANLALSDSQSARCRTHQCKFQGRKIQAVFGRADIGRISALLSKSRQTGQREQFKQGAITLHCQNELCVADLLVDDHRKHRFSAPATLHVREDASLFSSDFVAGMLQGAALAPSLRHRRL
jgi:hypothetical protein